MEFRNLTPFDALCFCALGMDDQEYPVLVMKVGYRLLPIDGQTGQFRVEVLEEDPLSLCTADSYYGEEGLSSVCEESDLAPFKPRCDVIVVGNAYAPQGQPAAHWSAGLRISVPVAPPSIDVPLPTPLSPGERLNQDQLFAWQAARQEALKQRSEAPTHRYLLEKHLKFTGPRQFRHSLFGGWQLSEPLPATLVPLRWEYAFGGSSVVPNPEHAVDTNTAPYLLNEVCYSNPLGRGWIEKRQEDLGYQLDNPLRELPAPQIEPIDKPVWRLVRAKHPEVNPTLTAWRGSRPTTRTNRPVLALWAGPGRRACDSREPMAPRGNRNAGRGCRRISILVTGTARRPTSRSSFHHRRFVLNCST